MIGILILNYKKYQVTADCIRSVLDTGDGLDYHIYVLDNGSGNDSIACLQARFPNNPRITWMESAENTGYARGNNQMLSRARKDGCTAAVITNSDIVFLPGTLQQLAAGIAEGHPIVGPRLQYPNGQRQNSVKLRPYTYREYLWTETYLRNLVPKSKLQALRRQPATPGEVYWLSGAVFAVDTAVFHRLGDLTPIPFYIMRSTSSLSGAKHRTLPCGLILRSRRSTATAPLPVVLQIYLPDWRTCAPSYTFSTATGTGADTDWPPYAGCVVWKCCLPLARPANGQMPAPTCAKAKSC